MDSPPTLYIYYRFANRVLEFFPAINSSLLNLYGQGGKQVHCPANFSNNLICPLDHSGRRKPIDTTDGIRPLSACLCTRRLLFCAVRLCLCALESQRGFPAIYLAPYVFLPVTS